MKIKKIQKISSSSKKKPKTKHPILQSRLHKDKVDRKSHKITSSPTKPMSLAEQAKQTEHMMKFYGNGITIANIRKVEDKDRVLRARKELKIFFVKSKQAEVFKFFVKSSGKHMMLGSYRIAEKYQVEIMWKDADKMIAEGKSAEHILKHSRVRLQCGCPDCTFYCRFWLTKAKAVLGMQELRFPKMKNPNGKGFICKHMILLTSKVTNQAFLNIFTRYIENRKIGKQTRIKQKDTISTHLSSGRSKAVEE